jgi:hypothetical protein
MGFLTVHRICNAANGPAPTREALSSMLDQMTRTLAELRHRPVRILKVESWPWRKLGGGDQLLARLRIECEDGEPTKTFHSWYQWQHPRWEWSLAMLPTVDLTSVESVAAIRPLPPPDAVRHPSASAQEARP